MKLYEVRNGYERNSFVRCYVWAESTNMAWTMALNKFVQWQAKHTAGKPPITKNACMKELFDADADPFVSEVSDEGFQSPAKEFMPLFSETCLKLEEGTCEICDKTGPSVRLWLEAQCGHRQAWLIKLDVCGDCLDADPDEVVSQRDTFGLPRDVEVKWQNRLDRGLDKYAHRPDNFK